MIQLQKVANRESSVIEIELDDLREFFDSIRDMSFVERVRINTSRYISLFSQTIDEVMPQTTLNLREEDLSTFDIMMKQRRYNAANAEQHMINQGLIKPGEQPKSNGLTKMGIPPELERSYHLSIVPGGNSGKKHYTKLREIKASTMGGLITVKGIITRCSDVQPCM